MFSALIRTAVVVPLLAVVVLVFALTLLLESLQQPDLAEKQGTAVDSKSWP
ncbi:MAG TPA: hypothetical protein VK130_09060 [Steroidobacteraceae bacterium]|nr:hypothetical protein [Steroidobacteraceae bacterium]